jgi:EAL domain-containing protein (putative c-di-GMP-specific phosphodiesterase class I)
VILADVADIVTATSSARRLIQALERPFQVFGHEVFIATSIGVSCFPEHGDSIDALLQNADAATYHAKAQGPNMLCLYTPALNAETSQRMRLENDLRRALERGELVLHYQPRMDIIGGRLVGAEALLRWQHAERGLMQPPQFIGLAEDTGLIVPIGEWVLRHACEQFCAWQAAGVAPPRLSVNVSARQLGHPELQGVIVSALEEAGMSPDALELEITEGTLMEHVEGGIARLQELGSMGVHLSIDDFGTGYSSLSMLKRLPIDALKVDRSFVGDIAVSPNDRAITTAIIAMADTLELKVVAEGVETQAQLDLLREWGCAEAQGTFFSGPLPLETFVEFLHGTALADVKGRMAPPRQQLDVSGMGM